MAREGSKYLQWSRPSAQRLSDGKYFGVSKFAVSRLHDPAMTVTNVDSKEDMDRAGLHALF